MDSIILTIIFAVTMRLFVFEIKFAGIRRKIMDKSRLWDIFLNCPFCNGFWTGIAMSLFISFGYFTGYNNFGELVYRVVFLFCMGVAVGSISYLIHNFYENIEKDDSFFE